MCSECDGCGEVLFSIAPNSIALLDAEATVQNIVFGVSFEATDISQIGSHSLETLFELTDYPGVEMSMPFEIEVGKC